MGEAIRSAELIELEILRAQAHMGEGFAFRDFQFEALELLAGGQDVIVSVPTGGGKTAIYQGYSLLGHGLPQCRGVVLVVSPLRALLVDQLRRYKESGLSVEGVWGETRLAERKRIFADIAARRVGTVITTPEGA